MFEEIASSWRRDGLLGAAKSVARLTYLHAVRPFLPRSVFFYNQVKVQSGRIFDDKAPISALKGHVPDYESALCRSLRDFVRPGDHVVIVGGGNGVTSTVAAQKTGTEGSVTVYEPDKQRYENLKKTVRLNGVHDSVRIHRAFVGSGVKIDASLEGARQIEPGELPPADVLELDCEGVEVEILSNMSQRPRVISVESHGHMGASTDDVLAILKEKEYIVQRVEVAEDHMAEFCLDKDIRVITASDSRKQE